MYFLVKTGTLWITLNINGVPKTSKSHTHPSHSETVGGQMITLLTVQGNDEER